MRFRPRLEALDERAVPASLTWTGEVSNVFENAANWRDTYTGAHPTQGPSAGDNLAFAGTFTFGDPEFPTVLVTSHDCYGLRDLTGAYASVTIQSSYSARATVTGALDTGSFTLAGGTIDQASTVDEITVTSAFSWTGGTLNSTANLATLTLYGAAGNIAPAGGGTLSLGSNITFVDGADVTMSEGTISITNDGVAFEVNTNCQMLVQAGQGKVVRTEVIGPVTQGNPLLIKQGGVFKVLTGHYAAANGSLAITGGSFVLEGGSSAFFGQKVPGLPGNLFIAQSAGVIRIAADANLQALGDIGVVGGEISIVRGAKPQQGFVANIIVIGTLKIAGGSITFDNAGGSPRTWSEFVVDGSVEWTGGTYYPYVDAESSGDNADLWVVNNGTFKIGQGASIVPTALDYEGSVVTPPSNTEWRLFASDTAITILPNNNDPSVSAGWSFVKDNNNPKKWWDLKKN